MFLRSAEVADNGLIPHEEVDDEGSMELAEVRG